MEINRTVCKYTNMRKEGIQRVILFIDELFANVRQHSLHVKLPHKSSFLLL